MSNIPYTYNYSKRSVDLCVNGKPTSVPVRFASVEDVERLANESKNVEEFVQKLERFGSANE